jgi:hypothetical protein
VSEGEAAELIPERFRCGDHQCRHLIADLDAHLHSGAPSNSHSADHADAVVVCFGNGLSCTGKHSSRSCLGVERIGLSACASCPAVGAVDFGHRAARPGKVARQSGAV